MLSVIVSSNVSPFVVQAPVTTKYIGATGSVTIATLSRTTLTTSVVSPAINGTVDLWPDSGVRPPPPTNTPFHVGVPFEAKPDVVYELEITSNRPIYLVKILTPDDWKKKQVSPEDSSIVPLRLWRQVTSLDEPLALDSGNYVLYMYSLEDRLTARFSIWGRFPQTTVRTITLTSVVPYCWTPVCNPQYAFPGDWQYGSPGDCCPYGTILGAAPEACCPPGAVPQGCSRTGDYYVVAEPGSDNPPCKNCCELGKVPQACYFTSSGYITPYGITTYTSLWVLETSPTTGYMALVTTPGGYATTFTTGEYWSFALSAGSPTAGSFAVSAGSPTTGTPTFIPQNTLIVGGLVGLIMAMLVALFLRRHIWRR